MNKVARKQSGEIGEKVGEETETIDIPGNNEGCRTEEGERGKCPGSSYVAESDGSFRESFISRKFMIQVTAFRRGGGGKKNDWRSYMVETTGVGKGDKFKWQGQVPRHPRGRFIVSMRRHTMTQFKKK